MHWFGAFLGSLIGFVAALMPEVFDMLKAHFSHKRELEAQQAALDAAAKGYQLTIDNQSEQICALQSENAQLQLQLQDCDDAKGHWVLQFLRSSVRPILTYAFFLLFAVVKLYSLRYALVVERVSIVNALPILWDEDTESLFAAVMTFWFGTRAMGSVKKANAPKSTYTTNLKGTAPVVSGE